MAFLPSALIPSMGGYNPYAMPQYAMSPPQLSGYNPYGTPPMGGYNPNGPSFPYGGNPAVNDYAQQSAQASAAIRNVQQITPGPVGEMLGMMDKLGQAFGPSNLSADPAFNTALDQLTGIPGGIPGYSPQGSSFPNFPLTRMRNDPRMAQQNPSGFPYSAYNPTYPVYPYPMYAGLGQPQYQQSGYGYPYGGFGGYGQFQPSFRFA